MEIKRSFFKSMEAINKVTEIGGNSATQIAAHIVSRHDFINVISKIPEIIAVNKILKGSKDLEHEAKVDSQDTNYRAEIVQSNPKVLEEFKKKAEKTNLPLESATAFTIKAGFSSWDFITIPPVVNDKQETSDEKLFLRDVRYSKHGSKDVRYFGLVKTKNKAADGTPLITWQYMMNLTRPDNTPSDNIKIEPVMWYPDLTKKQWEEVSRNPNLDSWYSNVGFAPPSTSDWTFPGYDRDDGQAFVVDLSKLPGNAKNAMLTREAIVETKKFSVCTPENFRKCKITADQLRDGTYLNWLRTLSKPFDPSKIRTDISLANYTDEKDNPKFIIYKITAKDTKGMFTGPNKGKEPFRRDVTAGYVDYVDDQGREWKYIVRPIEFFDKNNPTVNQWVITLQAFPMWWHNYTDADIDNNANVWKEKMNLTPILCTDKYEEQDFGNPLIEESFAKFDMKSKFIQFAGKLAFDPDDVSALSEPGLLLSTYTRESLLFQ